MSLASFYGHYGIFYVCSIFFMFFVQIFITLFKSITVFYGIDDFPQNTLGCFSHLD
jgi:hypothetical protein